MRATLIAALILTGFTAAAAAQTVGGSYTVSGANANGSKYSGTAQITPTGDGCHISWRTGSTSSSGVCMLANKSFAAYYKLGAKTGLVIYELHSDGSLSGWWTITDQKGVGTETLTPR